MWFVNFPLMKKILLSAFAAIIATTALAELNGDGFYRVSNAVTKRYAYLTDNRGSFDAATTSADVNALQLFSGFDKAVSDPATVFLLQKVPGTKYDHNIGGQGTSLYDFLGTFLKILQGKDYDGKPAYYAYASKSGFTKYLGDLRDNNDPQGFPSVDAKGENRLWYIDPVSPDDDNSYFGVTPTVNAGGKYYHPFFAGFPFAASSQGMKFLMVVKVDPTYGIAVVREVNGVIPAGTPVIVECASTQPSGNRLDIRLSDSYADNSGNRLSGVYFDNSTTTHWNRTPYDANTMRCLMERNGKLVFAKAGYDYVPRNQAFLSLSGAETAVDTYEVMTEPEYNAYIDNVSRLTGEGFYRLQNAGTKRYAYMADSKGNIAGGDVDAMQLFSGLLRASSDPATVFYMELPSDAADPRERNLSSQTTNVKQAFGSYLRLSAGETVDGAQTFLMHSASGQYLGDADASSAERGDASTGASGSNRLWYLNPLSETADNHFGIAPTLTAGGKYFYPFFASFPFKAHSEGMKFYTVSRIDTDLAVMVLKELSGIVPSGTPVIVECSAPLAADNRLVVGAEGEPADVSGNLLSGVYFDCTDAGHENVTPYDKESMRVLTVVNGKLMFAPADIQNVARNQAYVKLLGSSQKAVESYRVMTAAEYNEYAASLNESLPTGYYRMQNASTKRYAYLNGAKGSLSGTPDLSVLHLCNDILKAQSDPATVFGIVSGPSTVSAAERDVVTQGTSFARVFSSYTKFNPAEKVDGRQTFNISAVNGSSRIYLSDSGEGEWITAGTPGAASEWFMTPVDAQSESDWFGVTPSVTAGGKYYAPFMAGFPVTAASEGVKFHIISKVNAQQGVLIIEELEGTVPANTPVIVECAGPLASDNRLAPGETDNMAEVKGNRLKGVWFDCLEDSHANATAFNQESMRMLAADGDRLVFAKAQIDYVPRNYAFMELSGILQLGVETYKVMTQKEFEQQGGVDGVIADDATVDVFGIDGTLLRSGMKRGDVRTLGSGIFIVRSGSRVEKLRQ